MKRLVIVIVLTVSYIFVFAQGNGRSQYLLEDLLPQLSGGQGQVQITSDEHFADVLTGYVNYLHSHPIRGWRVQIFFGMGRNARSRAQVAMRRFQSKYPDVPIYLVFEQPYFKVRVGNFATRAEATKFLFLIKADFPKAFLTEDNIDIKRLTY